MIQALPIPPIPHLPVVMGRPMHLLLAHLMDNEDYVQFFREERARDAFLILDNSAHEFKAGLDVGRLLRDAKRVYAHEIVLPDVLFNASGTVENTVKALQYIYMHRRDYYDAGAPRLMMVPQGDTIEALTSCLDAQIRAWVQFASMWPGFAPRVTLGVSKDYEVFPGGLLGVLDNVIMPRVRKVTRVLQHDIVPIWDALDCDVHLLGWGRDLWAYKPIVDKYGWAIRSVDSAKPFVYAKARIFLNPWAEIPPYPTRDLNYFYEEIPYTDAMRHNVEMLDLLVKETPA